MENLRTLLSLHFVRGRAKDELCNRIWKEVVVNFRRSPSGVVMFSVFAIGHTFCGFKGARAIYLRPYKSTAHLSSESEHSCSESRIEV
jgi:hypothetical protein